jgi:DNA-directed RNA polymerase subunit F
MPEDFEVVKVLAHKSSKASEDDLKQAFEVVKKYLK